MRLNDNSIYERSNIITTKPNPFRGKIDPSINMQVGPNGISYAGDRWIQFCSEQLTKRASEVLPVDPVKSSSWDLQDFGIESELCVRREQ
jgi:hypothetical protein